MKSLQLAPRMVERCQQRGDKIEERIWHGRAEAGSGLVAYLLVLAWWPAVRREMRMARKSEGS